MTVTHIQLLLGKRGCVDKETDRQRKKGLFIAYSKMARVYRNFTVFKSD